MAAQGAIDEAQAVVGGGELRVEFDGVLEIIDGFCQRHEPEFQAMVAEIKADMAAQLERVRAMEASGELDPVPEVN